MPRESRQAVRWDAYTAVLVGVYTGSVFPFLGRIARGDLHASSFELSVLTAAPFVGHILSPLWARQMEGRSKMPFVVWSATMARGLILLMALATRSLPFVLIASACMFIGTIASPAYTSIMKEVYPDRVRGRIMGSIRMVLQAATLVATLILGRVLDVVSYRVIFPAAALIGLLGAYTFSRIETKPVEEEPERFTLWQTLSILKEDRNYRWFGLSVFTYGLGNLMAQPVYTIFQVDTLHITNTMVANLANFQSAVAIVAYVYWGRYLDRKGPLNGVAVCVFLAGIIPVIYLFTTDVRTLYLVSFVGGVTWAGIDLAYINSILSFADDRRIAEYQSIHSLLLGIRGLVGPFLGTALMGVSGMRAVFVASFVLIMAGFFMQTLGVRLKYNARPL